MVDLTFYKNKKVLITGHTGFKGSWLCKCLIDAGALVTGYALEPPTEPSLFKMCELETEMHSIIGDIRDLKHLQQTFENIQPEIVIHMAAQPLVRKSYEEPVHTYEVNVMGTVNVLECIRHSISVKSFLNVTTDKVYLNKEWQWGYRENEELNGYDPYSNSKSCSELITDSYKNCFFSDKGSSIKRVAISTARAGNVIGGGDFSADRIIPDCLRAFQQGKALEVRNPYSMRPYQHVLEPVIAYLLIAMEQYRNIELAGNYNVGPNEQDCWTTGNVASLFCEKWNAVSKNQLKWVQKGDGGPHEANFLKLDCSMIKSVFGWRPKWSLEDAVERVIEWNQVYLSGEDVSRCLQKQIVDYCKGL